MSWILALIAMVLPAAVQDAPVRDLNAIAAECPPADVIKAIDHDFKLVFEHDPTAGTHECTAGTRDLTIMQSRVYRALATLRSLEFTEPLPWTKDSAYRWLTRSVRGIRFRAGAENSSCCDRDNLISVKARVEPAPNGGQMGFAMAITDSRSMATDARLIVSFLQLLVHEARHNNGKPHTCGTKDQTIREMGAWGAAYTFQQWIVEKTPPGFVSDAVRANLRQQMDQICRFQICKEACGAQ